MQMLWIYVQLLSGEHVRGYFEMIKFPQGKLGNTFTSTRRGSPLELLASCHWLSNYYQLLSTSVELHAPA
jgi:hypothetical protein